jgi:hypothetical protein
VWGDSGMRRPHLREARYSTRRSTGLLWLSPRSLLHSA